MSAITVDCAAVDFDLSTDQEALRDAAANAARPQAGRARARVGAGAVVGRIPGAGTGEVPSPGAGTGGRCGRPRATNRRVVGHGVAGLARHRGPADEGGLGLGMVELAVLCEEIGRRAAPAPFVGSILCLGALGARRRRRRLATPGPKDAAGEADRLSHGAAVGCVAWSAAPDGLGRPQR